MILFTDDYKETQTSVLLAESQNLIIPLGIITMDMATDDEKNLLFGDKTIKEKPIIYV